MTRRIGYIHLNISGTLPILSKCQYRIDINNAGIISKLPLTGSIEKLGSKTIKFQYDDAKISIEDMLITYQITFGSSTKALDQGVLKASKTRNPDVLGRNFNLISIVSTAARTTVNAQQQRRVNVNTCKYPDGAIDVAEYILKEIHSNANSGLTKSIKNHLNSYAPARVARAYYLWGMQVAPGKPWDHKPIIKDDPKLKYLAVTRPLPSGLQSQSHYHKYKRYDYYYDIWSNIHYGYVGMSAGFSSEILTSGSYIQQMGLEALRELKRIARENDSIRNMKLRGDTEDDVNAIKIGISLYQQHPSTKDLKLQHILNVIDSAPDASFPNSKTTHYCYK